MKSLDHVFDDFCKWHLVDYWNSGVVGAYAGWGGWYGFFEFLPDFKLIISASNHVLVMVGMLCTVLYLRLRMKKRGTNLFLDIAFSLGLIFIYYGFLIRPCFPLSKILASPSWTAICIGLSFLTYVIIFLIVDKKGYCQRAQPIKPAGTSSLTC